MFAHCGHGGTTRAALAHRPSAQTALGVLAAVALGAGHQNRAAALRADEPSGGLQHAGGCQSSTLLVERLNHTIWQHVATLGCRVTTVCKGADGLWQ